MSEATQHKGEAPGQNKEFSIFVNGRQKTWADKEITFEQVVGLGFENPFSNPKTSYTVTYKKGEDKKPEGQMVAGDKVRVKDGMIFNATPTDKS